MQLECGVAEVVEVEVVEVVFVAEETCSSEDNRERTFCTSSHNFFLGYYYDQLSVAFSIALLFYHAPNLSPNFSYLGYL